jgi:nitroreductase
MVKKAVKKLLPRSLLDWLQTLRGLIDVYLTIMVSRSQWLSVIYYGLYSSEFRREMQSVLLARKHYYKSRTGHSTNTFLLRRNIHRLEKGLIMEPRRTVFAEGYIEETVESLERCLLAGCLSHAELTWAVAVIRKYFSVVEATEKVTKSSIAFQNIVRNLRDVELDSDHVPIAYSELDSIDVSFDGFKALCQRRHSVRWFKAARVPKHLLDAAVNVAATAPSACNRQAFKFYIFDEPDRARQIGAIPMGTAGFAHNFQTIVVVVGDLSAYPHEKDRHIIYIDSGLAVMQFQLALETQGLGSCVINWPDIERHERQMAAELNLNSYERPVMLIAVGYPLAQGRVPYSAKKSAADIVVRPG